LHLIANDIEQWTEATDGLAIGDVIPFHLAMKYTAEGGISSLRMSSPRR
jgi:hypothetical protein